MPSSLGDPHQAERLARLYENASSQLSDVGRTREVSIHHAVWQSPAADRYRHAATVRRAGCDHSAAEMQDIARALRRHANWIRETEAELRNLERRIRAWAAAHPPNPNDPAPDASLIKYWPPPLSSEWRNLAARLRANGAYF